MAAAGDADAAEHMEAPSLPTGPEVAPIQQDPGLAGTQLLTEIPIGPDLRLQALTNEKFHLVNQFITSDQVVLQYDMIVDIAPHSSDISNEKASVLSRHCANKGDTTEALSLLMSESGHHDLIIVMSWVIMQLQFMEQSYPCKANFLTR